MSGPASGGELHRHRELDRLPSQLRDDIVAFLGCAPRGAIADFLLVTLFLGIIMSVYSAVFLTRLVFDVETMGDDLDALADHLGFDRFCVAGHDRGARCAYRMALDHPQKVQKFASFDILPTHHVLTRATWQWALNSYHWFFMAQPYDIPEKLIEGREDYYILKKLTKMGIGKGGFSEATLQEYAFTQGCVLISRTVPGEKYQAPDGASSASSFCERAFPPNTFARVAG